MHVELLALSRAHRMLSGYPHSHGCQPVTDPWLQPPNPAPGLVDVLPFPDQGGKEEKLLIGQSPSGIESWPSYFITLWPWAGNAQFGGLRFFIHKMGTM